MANIKISQLNAASALTGTELIELIQGGTNVKSTVFDIRGTTLTTGSIYQITASWTNTASYAISSSAQGLVGQISAQVQEWTTTVSESATLYPSGNPLGVLSYVTDAQSVRIGDGETIAGVPVGVRYWTDSPATSLVTHDNKIGELGVFYDKYDTKKVNLMINLTSSNSTASWMPIISLSGIDNIESINNTIMANRLNIESYLFDIIYPKYGDGVSLDNYSGIAGTVFNIFQIYGGNGGDGTTGGNGGYVSNSFLFGGGHAGSDLDGISAGGNGGYCSYIIISIGGNGGQGSNGGTGGNGGNAGGIQLRGGNGGFGNGGYGGSGGNGGSIVLNGGNGHSEGGYGGIGGQLIGYGGQGLSASFGRGDAGTINISAQDYHSGGDILTQATVYRKGGSIRTFFDGYTTPCLFSVTSSLGANNTTASSNFWTSSNINGFSGQYITSHNNTINASVIDHIGRSVKVKAMGTLAANGSSPFTLKFLVSSSVFWQSPPISMSVAGTQMWSYDGLFTFRTISSLSPSLTGSLIGQGMLTCFTTPSSSINYSLPNTDSIPVDTFKTHQIFFTAQWDTASVGNNIQCTNAIVELVN